MKLRLLPFFIAFILMTSCNSQNSKGVVALAAKDFAEKIKTTEKPLLIDVRSPEEYNSSHLDGAVNIDWSSADFATKFTSFNKKEPLLVYCKIGVRSSRAADKLVELGFEKVYTLEGGLMKWDAAFPHKADDKTAGISRADFDKLVASKKKVLINIYAPWCAPCKKMEPYVLQMQKDLANDVLIVRLNADENKTIVGELKLEELPGLYLYENNTLKWQATGFVSEKDLKKQLL